MDDHDGIMLLRISARKGNVFFPLKYIFSLHGQNKAGKLYNELI